jgi:hypothetical protein
MYEAQMRPQSNFSAKVSFGNDVDYLISTNDTIPSWCKEEIKVPGYSRANHVFTDMINGDITVMPFIVSPSSFSENRATQQQMTKTTAGWFIMRMGQQFINIQLTGYMLDTEKMHERQSFILAYNTYISDS